MNVLKSQSPSQARPSSIASNPAARAARHRDSRAVPDRASLAAAPRRGGQRLSIELDLYTVDASTDEPLPLFDSIAGSIPEKIRRHIKGNAAGCKITITSSPHASLRDLRDELHDHTRSLQRLLRPQRAKLLWSGLHPWSDPCDALVVPATGKSHRSRCIAQAPAAWQPCGVKFRFELPKGEASRALNHMKGFAPLLVALSANSAILRDRRTDGSSQRVLIRSAISASEWIAPRLVAGLSSDDRATIEIGCCDVPQNLDRVIALAAIVQALVASGGRGGHRAAPTDEFVRAELYEAAKNGLDARLTDGNGRIVSPLRLLDDLIHAELEPVAIELGIDAALRLAPTVLDKSGSGEHVARLGSYDAKHGSSTGRPERGRGTSLATLATAASLLLAGGLFAAQATLG